MIRISEFVGQTLAFYGAVDTYFKLGDHIFFAKIDEDDGYRSTLESCETIDPQSPDLDHRHFSSIPLAVVKVLETEHTRIDGWRLRDTEGHEWLVVGTDTSDDYYPSFHFAYDPVERA